MKFKLEITMDNAAFVDDAGAELGRILHEIAERTEQSGIAPGSSGTVRDVNGNAVGSFRATGRRLAG